MNRRMSQEYVELKKVISGYIDKYSSPTPKINKDNLRRLQEIKGDPDLEKERLKLRETIALSNGGFAMKYVMKYYNVLTEDTSISELFQEATIGLLESIDTFDISKNTSFTTYAYFHVRKRIIDFIKKNKLVKAPRDIARNIKHVNEAQEYIRTTTGREATSFEIKEALKKRKGIEVKESIITSIMVLLDLNSSGYEDSFISEYKDQYHDEADDSLFRKLELNILSALSQENLVNEEAVKMRFGIGFDYAHSPNEVKLLLSLTDEDLEEI